MPAGNPARCFALTLYGGHAAGTDLDYYERALLGRIARDAAVIYAELESRELREKVIALEANWRRDPEAPTRNEASGAGFEVSASA